MNIYSRTLGALKPFWRQLTLASFSAALHAVFSGLLVWMVGPLLTTLFKVDVPGISNMSPMTDTTLPGAVGSDGVVASISGFIAGLKNGLKGFIDYLVNGSTPTDTLLNFCLVILAIVLLKNIFLYIQSWLMVYVQQAVMREFRDRLFAKYQRLSLSYFHSRRTGQVMSRITNDVVVLNDAIELAFNRFITDAILAVMLLAFLIIISWKLTLLSMIVMPLVFGFIWWVGRKMRKYSIHSQERMADVNSVLEESVNNMRIVKAFSMEHFEAGKFFSATKAYFRALLRMNRIGALASPINDTLATIAGVALLMFAGSQIISGEGDLQAGDFMTFILAMFSLIKPVKSLSQVHIRFQQGMAAADRIFEVLDTTETIVEAADPKSLTRFNSLIKYDNVEFQYLAGEPVLRGVSFEVRPGEVVAVVGPSGAGKSTLLDLLPRFYDVLGGKISIDGIDVREMSFASLRGLMGIVTQETFLFNDSIYNNIAYGLENISKDKVIEASKAANAHDFIMEFAEGYETIVGNRGEKLSGGQRQRLAIARALLKNPQILIFDEATSSLDTESEMLVQQAIDRLMSNRTTLVIAHRLSTVKNADRILVLEKGKILECGTHTQLMEIDGLYKRLYSMQFRDVV